MQFKTKLPLIDKDLNLCDLVPETDGLGLPSPTEYVHDINSFGSVFQTRHKGIDVFSKCDNADKTGYYRLLMYRMASTCIRQHLGFHPADNLSIEWCGQGNVQVYEDQMTKQLIIEGMVSVRSDTVPTYEFMSFRLYYSFNDEVRILTLDSKDAVSRQYNMRPNTHNVCHPQTHVDMGMHLSQLASIEYQECTHYVWASHDRLQTALKDATGKISLPQHDVLKKTLRFVALEFREEAIKYSNLSRHMGDIIVDVRYDNLSKEFVFEGFVQVVTYMGNVGYLSLSTVSSQATALQPKQIPLEYELPCNNHSGIGAKFGKQVPQYFKNSKAMGSSMMGDAMKSLGDAFKDVSDSSKGLPDHLKEVFSKPPQHHNAPTSIGDMHDYEVETVKQSGDPMKQPNTQAGLKAGMSLADAVAHAQKAKAATQGNKEAKLMNKPTATGLAGFFKTRVKKHFGKTVTVNAKGFGQLKQLITRVGEKRVYRAMESVLDNWDDFLLYVKQEKNWTPDCNVPNIGILLHLADEVQEFYAMQSGDKDVDEGKTAFQTQDEIDKSNDNTINDIWG